MKTTLITCPACERELSRNAASCPHCGEPGAVIKAPGQSATGVLAAILIALIVGGFLYFIIVGH